jgi:hypothetical protein
MSSHWMKQRRCAHCGLTVRGNIYFKYHGMKCKKRGG